jgi:hypothetical protein
MRIVKDQKGMSRAMNRNDHKAVEAIHKKECEPDCPWDGRTIFPETRA